MALPMVLESTVLAFGVQLILCFRGKKLITKWLPMIVVLVMDLLSWGIYLSTDRTDWLVLPYLFAFLCLLWLAGIGLAWAVYGIVKAIQKRK